MERSHKRKSNLNAGLLEWLRTGYPQNKSPHNKRGGWEPQEAKRWYDGGDKYAYQFSHGLARAVQGYLKRLSGGRPLGEYDPQDFEDVVKVYTKEYIKRMKGISTLLPIPRRVKEVWESFLAAWYRVELPEGEGEFSVLLRRVRADKRKPTFPYSWKAVQETADVCRLHDEEYPGQPFTLPVKAVAGGLGYKSTRKPSDIRQILLAQGVIVPHARYSVKKGIAASFRFVHPRDRVKKAPGQDDTTSYTRKAKRVERRHREEPWHPYLPLAERLAEVIYVKHAGMRPEPEQLIQLACSIWQLVEKCGESLRHMEETIALYAQYGQCSSTPVICSAHDWSRKYAKVMFAMDAWKQSLDTVGGKTRRVEDWKTKNNRRIRSLEEYDPARTGRRECNHKPLTIKTIEEREDEKKASTFSASIADVLHDDEDPERDWDEVAPVL